MLKFGTNPPRKADSLGVAGLLDADCKVFYGHLFSLRHVGRISDLLVARLAGRQPDELRLRAVLLFALFEGYRSQAADAAAADEKGVLLEPLTLECGIDDERIAIGVTCRPDAGFDPKELADRVAANSPKGELERLLTAMHPHADRLLLRVVKAAGAAEAQQVEIVALLALPGKIAAAEAAKRVPIQVILLGEAGEAPAPGKYVELGDVDYRALLAEDAPGKAKAADAPCTGEVLAQDCTELEAALRLRAQAAAIEERLKVKGRAAAGADALTRIKGAETGDLVDRSVIRLAGSADGKSAASGDALRAYQLKIEALERKLAELQSGAGVASESNSDSGAGDGPGADETDGGGGFSFAGAVKGKSIKGLFKKVWSLRKGADADEDEDEDEGEDEADGADHGRDQQAVANPSQTSALPASAATTAAKPGASASGADESDDGETFADESRTESASTRKSKGKGRKAAAAEGESGDAAEGESSPEAEANSLIVEIQTGSLDRTLSRAQEEMVEFKREMNSTRAKRWIDGLMGDLVAEKARLHDLARKLNSSIRQKEHDFRQKEIALQEEIRRRDEMLRQKNNSLTRAKEQLTQSNMTLEKLKVASQERADDAHFKQKHALVQKMLTSAQEENAKLGAKTDELKALVVSLQLAAKKGAATTPSAGVSSGIEMAGLKQKYDRASRQAEELRNLNEQMRARVQLLTERLEAVGAGTNGAVAPASPDATRKRLEAAMKLAATAQKENSQLREATMHSQLRTEELEQETARLNKELARAREELKALKDGRGSGGSTGSGGSGPKAA